jgi:hypothetical protein
MPIPIIVDDQIAPKNKNLIRNFEIERCKDFAGRELYYCGNNSAEIFKHRKIYPTKNLTNFHL